MKLRARPHEQAGLIRKEREKECLRLELVLQERQSQSDADYLGCWCSQGEKCFGVVMVLGDVL